MAVIVTRSSIRQMVRSFAAACAAESRKLETQRLADARRDQDLVLAEHLRLTGDQLGEAVAGVGDELGPAHDLKALLQRREVVGADDDHCRRAMAGDDDTVVLTLDLVHNLGQAVLCVPQRHGSFGTHSHMCSQKVTQSEPPNWYA